jgi:hypothetical protein
MEAPERPGVVFQLCTERGAIARLLEEFGVRADSLIDDLPRIELINQYGVRLWMACTMIYP